MISPRLPFWMVVRCNRRRRAALARASTVTRRKRAARRIWRWTRSRYLLALLVTAANAQERAQVGALAERVREVTGEHVELAFVDQGYTGPAAAEAAKEHGVRLDVVKLTEAKKGFVLLSRRWVVERSFAWTGCFRRLARDYERLPETLAGLHFLPFIGLLLGRPVATLGVGS